VLYLYVDSAGRELLCPTFDHALDIICAVQPRVVEDCEPQWAEIREVDLPSRVFLEFAERISEDGGRPLVDMTPYTGKVVERIAIVDAGPAGELKRRTVEYLIS
jgi:hypothetical protein